MRIKTRAGSEALRLPASLANHPEVLHLLSWDRRDGRMLQAMALRSVARAAQLPCAKLLLVLGPRAAVLEACWKTLSDVLQVHRKVLQGMQWTELSRAEGGELHVPADRPFSPSYACHLLAGCRMGLWMVHPQERSRDHVAPASRVPGGRPDGLCSGMAAASA